MIQKYFDPYYITLQTGNLLVSAEQVYAPVQDKIKKSLTCWAPTDEIYVTIKELNGAKRELAFYGDVIFANNIVRLSKKFDDFGVVVNGTRVLLEQA